MKERVTAFVKTYALLLGIFVVQKPLFMLYYSSRYADVAWSDWLSVPLHGLPLDLSVAGYLTAIPGLLLVVSVWWKGEVLRRIGMGYAAVVALLLSVIFVVDLGLYDYWGFRLDTTPLFYFFSSPADAVASVSAWVVAGGVVLAVLVALLLYGLMHRLLLRRAYTAGFKLPYRRVGASVMMLLLTGLLFIPIRGGFSVSTMNTGKVYFSPHLKLNHAAINPAFSLLESVFKESDFASQYRFMEPADADRLFRPMLDAAFGGVQLGADTLAADTVPSLLNTRRPDVLFVILESFSSRLMTTLGGEPDIAVNLDSLTAEGVLFTRFYGNSFRTDRGLVSVLSGYPAQPTTSLMKYPRKTQHLPSIAASLKRAGYATKYYYGGDADFTNMRSYLVASGFDEIVCDEDFPISQRLSKWGAHDEVLFDRVIADLAAEAESQAEPRTPHYRVVQTSSSHEPFEVPYRRLENNRLNAFAYTDSCLGNFVRRFRRLPQWQHTLVVLVPDHMGAYPRNIENLCFERFQIPLLLIGGAVQEARKVDVYGSQQDIAATLLGQMQLPHDDFRFSKDMLNPRSPHFAFFTMPDAFGMVTEENRLIFNCQAGSTAVDEGSQLGANLERGKAYLQKLYDDIDALGKQ